MIDADSILHPSPFTESVSEVLTKAFESWDVVRQNFDLINDTLTKVVNKVTRKQNEIHTRIEQKRPWGNCEYRISKFDYLGDRFKIKMVQCRDVITGEVPVEVIEIPKSLVVGAHNQETFESFFTAYETNLADSVALRRKDNELLAEEFLKLDFEKAKAFYFEYKDRFEKEGE
jgi:hypothetical protein